jgi:hypothetical protein
MVRPAHFGFNPETAVTNHLQQRGPDEAGAARDARAGQAEFDAMVLQLRAAGVRVGVLEDEPEPPLPDSVFPNNWISFHPDGTVVLYPMQSPSRRRERRPAALLAVAGTLGFRAKRTVDFTADEARERYLEGTGSLVLDHRERIAYCALSPRSDAGLASEWAAELGYELEAFGAATASGASIYHTNVLLWIGERVAGLGLDWIAPADRPRVRERLAASGRQLVDLPAANLARFAGNMLELRSVTGRLVLVMSASAAASLDPAQRAALLAGTDEFLIAAVPTIELRGGGSVRCMLAEVP